MINQFISYKDAASDTPGDTTHDQGGLVVAAIRPIIDLERAQADVVNRPHSIIQRRTAILSEETSNLKYLSDADRTFSVDTTGTLTWVGPTVDGGVDGLGILSLSANLIIKPFLAPASSSRAQALIRGVVFRTAIDGETADVFPRAYSHANELTVKVTGSDGATLSAVLITTNAQSGLLVTVDTNVATGTTCQELVTFINGSAVAQSIGIKAVLDTGTIPTDIYAPEPPGFIWDDDHDFPTLKGAADAEVHIITAAGLATFFTTLTNRLAVGDVLALTYDTIEERRASLTEAPESIVDSNAHLFVIRNNTSHIPGAVPIARVLTDGTLLLLNQKYLGISTQPIGTTNLSTVTPTTVDTTAYATVGTSLYAARADHKHGLDDFVIRNTHVNAGAAIATTKLKPTAYVPEEVPYTIPNTDSVQTTLERAINALNILVPRQTQQQVSAWGTRDATTGDFRAAATLASGRVCIAGMSSVCYTTDDVGYTWTSRAGLATATSSADVHGLHTCVDGYTYAVCSGGKVARTDDGVTWTLVYTAPSAKTLYAMTSSPTGALIVAVGDSSMVTWSSGPGWAETAVTGVYRGVTKAPSGPYVAVGNAGKAFSTPDGVTITSCDFTDPTYDWHGITSVENTAQGYLYVSGSLGAVCRGSISGLGVVTWESIIDTGPFAELRAIMWYRNILVMVGNSGVCLTSADSLDTTLRRTLPDTKHYFALADTGVSLVAVSSTDGVIFCTDIT